MQVKLLRQVKAHILDEPRRLHMDHGLMPKYGKDAPACGTVGCIAGWTVVLANKKRTESAKATIKRLKIPRSESLPRERSWSAIEDMATEILGIRSSAAERLFYTWNWPNALVSAYRSASSAAERAKITARRIERFIRTKGQE